MIGSHRSDVPLWELSVLGQVPADPRAGSERSEWSARQLDVDSPASFIEGPVPDPRGGVYLVDIAWGRILHMDERGRTRCLVTYDGEPCGLARLGEDLVVTDFALGLLTVRLGNDAATVSPLLTRKGVSSFRGLNDLVIGPDDSIYFTDQGGTGLHDPNGELLRLFPDGRVETLVSGVPGPNGLVLDVTQKTIFLAATRDNSIWRVPLGPAGAWKVGRFIQMSGGMGPDGLALTQDGVLLVAHLGLGTVWAYDPLGTLLGGFTSPQGLKVTNVAIAGDRVIVTEAETGCVLVGSLAPVREARAR